MSRISIQEGYGDLRRRTAVSNSILAGELQALSEGDWLLPSLHVGITHS